MSKLVLLSLLLGTLVLPHHLARIASRSTAYRKLKIWMFLCCLVYILLLIYVYPRVEGG